MIERKRCYGIRDILPVCRGGGGMSIKALSDVGSRSLVIGESWSICEG